ncbi:MAG: DNA primase [Alphaproteobacteria bacterium]
MDFSYYIDIVKSQFLLSGVIKRDLKLTRRGKEFVALCPFHKEKTPSFTVNDQKGFYHCFGCGVHGDLVSYVMKRYNRDFKEVLFDFLKELGVSLPTKEVSKDYEELYKILEHTCVWYQERLKNNEGKEAKEYLEKRGIFHESIKDFYIGYAPFNKGKASHLYQELKSLFAEELLSQSGLFVYNKKNMPFDRFQDRIIFPIHNAYGRVIAFGGRTISDKEPKYINSSETPIFQKHKNLYHFYKASKCVCDSKPFIIVEGYFDVIAMVNAGFDTTVASLGTSLGVEQLNLLWKKCKAPVLCFDGDFAGENASYRVVDNVLPLLEPFKTLSFCFFKNGKDPDSVLREKGERYLNSILESRIPFVDTFWNFLQNKYFISSSSIPEKKGQFKKNIIDYTNSIKNNDMKSFYKKDLLKRFEAFCYPRFFKKKIPSAYSIKSPFKEKKELLKRILLAIVIKYPKLLEEVFESFSLLDFKDSRYSILYVWMLTHADDCFVDVEKDFVGTEMEPYLKTLFSDDDIHLHAPFIFDYTKQEKEVLEYWWDIWNMLVNICEVRKEYLQVKAKTKESLHPEHWQQFKILKTQRY